MANRETARELREEPAVKRRGSTEKEGPDRLNLREQDFMGVGWGGEAQWRSLPLEESAPGDRSSLNTNQEC